MPFQEQAHFWHTSEPSSTSKPVTRISVEQLVFWPSADLLPHPHDRLAIHTKSG